MLIRPSLVQNDCVSLVIESNEVSIADVIRDG